MRAAGGGGGGGGGVGNKESKTSVVSVAAQKDAMFIALWNVLNTKYFIHPITGIYRVISHITVSTRT